MVDIYTTGELMVNPFINLWNSFVEMFPGLIAAIILVIVGYFIAAFLGYVIHQILLRLGLDKRMESANLSDAIGHVELSGLTGNVVKWYIFIMFLAQAVAIVSLGSLTNMLTSFLFWMLNVLVGLVIVIFGLILADYVCKRLEKVKIKSVRAISVLVRVLIVFFVAVMALKQIKLDTGIAENTFLIIIGAVALGLALAIGISFGFALKEEAKGIIKIIKKNL
ncbi:MAG: hypothetical protein ABH879_00020 [archaeon]